MSPETASLVHHGILAAGALIWFVALLVHRRTFPRADPLHPEPFREGEETVAAPAGDVRDRLLNSLRAGGMGGPGSIRIEEASDRRIRGSAIPMIRKNRPGSSVNFVIDLSDAGAGTRARYSLVDAPAGGLRTASAIFLYVLAPLAILAAVAVMRTFVLGSDSPAVRAQAIQTIHIVHFIWPPFLFAYVSVRLADAFATALANVIRNAGF